MVHEIHTGNLHIDINRVLKKLTEGKSGKVRIFANTNAYKKALSSIPADKDENHLSFSFDEIEVLHEEILDSKFYYPVYTCDFNTYYTTYKI